MQAGHDTTEVARRTMAEVVTAVRQVNALVDEISHAAGEQVGGISQEPGRGAARWHYFQQNAAMVEQMAAGAVVAQPGGGHEPDRAGIPPQRRERADAPTPWPWWRRHKAQASLALQA